MAGFEDLFAQVDDIVRSLCGPDSDDLRSRVHRSGIQLWFGSDKPTRLHFEAQVLGRKKVDGTDGLALEVGFHAEDRDESVNEAVLATLAAAEAGWRPMLGDEATAGVFFDADRWRRLSDVWIEPDLSGDDVAFDIASRLVDYLDAIQPVLNQLD